MKKILFIFSSIFISQNAFANQPVDWQLGFQKATELGVTKFLPIIFDRTVVRKINNERLEKIVIEASEQSNRLNVPEIEKAQNLKKFLNSNSIDLIFTDLNSNNKKIEKTSLSLIRITLVK